MPITLDHQLKEYIPHNAVEFPISYFHDELATLPNFAGPLHWHPDFEIATAECVSLDYQVGENHIILEAGDSIFVNRNTIHGIKQLSGGTPDPMPNIVFSGTLVAPETSTIYQKHIQPFAQCDFLPFIVFPADKETPAYMQYLGKVLPAAVFGLLIVYCMKDVSVFSESHGIPELISIAAVVLLHMWKRQMLLSIAGGTVCYMMLVQYVFV